MDGTDARPKRRSDEFVQSLERGLRVITAFGPERSRLTLTEVATHSGLTRATARRLLLTLEHLGYVGSEGTYYFLRPAVLQLGYAYLSALTISDIATIHLNPAADELHESCSASVLDGDSIVYIARASTTRIMSFTLSIGHRLPATSTSMGRVLLAALPDAELDALLSSMDYEPRTAMSIASSDELRAEIERVREQGYSIVDQELEVGVRSVAVPVRDAKGAVIASVNASAHATRIDLDTMHSRFLPRIQEVARAIEADLHNLR